MRTALFALFFVCSTAPAWAAEADNPWNSTAPYDACVEDIHKQADNAFEHALTWRDHGGGLPAEHCAALALMALDEPGEAASRLDTLAHRMDAGTANERAQLLQQSGNAWLVAGQPENAEGAFSAALKLAPRDAEIWTDRARARAQKQNWKEAEADLTKALSFDKKTAEAYVLRAETRSRQGNNSGYRADIDAALKVDATFPEALIERGAMRLTEKNLAGARADFLQVLVRAPNSPAGDTARDYIQKMEVKDR